MLLSLMLGASVLCSLVPAMLFCINLRRFRPPSVVTPEAVIPVSVLIPARNEEANIAEAVRCALGSRNVAVEVLVWDDASADRTAEIVAAMAAHDSRVRLLSGDRLPGGWNGKQHACWQLAQASRYSNLVFLDADVRVEPDLLARMAGFRVDGRRSLVSGFPRLITLTWLEQLLLPLIHFVLLAFLPMRAMRRRLWPSAAAGCGQFLLAEREAYFAVGGHSAIRETMHDGLLLPRVFRRAGYRTDIADITALASVRMYDSADKVWNGLAKNATEGIATPAKILPLTAILFLGQVLPALAGVYVLSLVLLVAVFRVDSPSLLSAVMRSGSPGLVSLYILAHGGFLLGMTSPLRFWGVLLTFAAVMVALLLPRLLAVRRFRQPLSSALLHPVGIAVLLVLQWYALARKLFGRPVGWRQRTYSSANGGEMGSGL